MRLGSWHLDPRLSYGCSPKLRQCTSKTLLECQNRTEVFPSFNKARTVGSIMSDQLSSRGSKETARLMLGMNNLMVKYFYHSQAIEDKRREINHDDKTKNAWEGFSITE